jgi:tRNA(fMet)-specific endonuclease VapC
VVPLYLLDTNVISELAKPRPDAQVISSIQNHQGLMAIPAIVWHELIYGVARLPQGNRKNLLNHFILDVVAPSFDVVPYDDRAAWIHGTQRAELEAHGNTLPFADSQIAAIAVSRNMILVTRNKADFSVIPALMLEDWFIEPARRDEK